MSNDNQKIVVAHPETPVELDIERIADRVRNDGVAGQVKASAEVYGDAARPTTRTESRASKLPATRREARCSPRHTAD